MQGLSCQCPNLNLSATAFEDDPSPENVNYHRHKRFKEAPYSIPYSPGLYDNYILPRLKDPDYTRDPSPTRRSTSEHQRKPSDLNARVFDSSDSLSEEEESEEKPGRLKKKGAPATRGRKRSQTRSEGVASSSAQQEVGEDEEMMSVTPAEEDTAESPGERGLSSKLDE